MAQIQRKLRAPVRVCQQGREPMDGYFFLNSRSVSHQGPETLLDRLNSSERVFPFERDTDGAIVLISRLSLEWVTPRGDLETGLVCPPTHGLTREELVRIRLVEGAETEGLLQMEIPEPATRALDFLNGPDDFFALFTPGRVLLINKLCVLDVRVYEEAPLPEETPVSEEVA